jgi:hypothetical protein
LEEVPCRREEVERDLEELPHRREGLKTTWKCFPATGKRLKAAWKRFPAAGKRLKTAWKRFPVAGKRLNTTWKRFLVAGKRSKTIWKRFPAAGKRFNAAWKRFPTAEKKETASDQVDPGGGRRRSWRGALLKSGGSVEVRAGEIKPAPGVWAEQLAFAIFQTPTAVRAGPHHLLRGRSGPNGGFRCGSGGLTHHKCRLGLSPAHSQGFAKK